MKKLWDLLEKKLGKNFLDNPVLVESIRELSLFFTEQRQQRPQRYLDYPLARRAYTAYYLPLNYLKLKEVLPQCRQSLLKNQKNKPEIHVLDFGCGPGTGSLAAIRVFYGDWKDKKIVFHLYDQSEASLREAVDFVLEYAKVHDLNCEARTYSSLHALDQVTYDLAIFANVLNELNDTNVFFSLWNKTKGPFVLLEPSHRVSSQKLIRLRERFLKRENAQILAPCSHHLTCPLYSTKHWCHFSSPHEEALLKKINLKIFKNPRLWLKYSYLILQKSPVVHLPNQYRIIGDLHPSGPGHAAIDLCAPRQKQVLRLPVKKMKAFENQLQRGLLWNADQTSHDLGFSTVAKKKPSPKGTRGPSKNKS